MDPSPSSSSTTEPVGSFVAGHAGQVEEVRASGRRAWQRLWPYLGPAFIAAVAYIDPGNFATNIQAGADFGYLLLWVIVASNLMAMVIQTLSAKLGLATGLSLPELIRDEHPLWMSRAQWVVAEVVAMATDLAEFLGAAIGLNLLFHIPLFLAGIITGVATFAILGLERHGARPLEAVIGVLLLVVGGCFLVEMVLGRPDLDAAATSFLPPRFEGTESVLLASGILGATVMPHVIYLHSALMRNRNDRSTPARRRRLFRLEMIDILIAMAIAGLVNAAMLMMAATVFWKDGIGISADEDIIEHAYQTLTPLLGGSASTIFGIALLAAGLSSSAVGTMAGQVIMQGFLRRTVHVTVRRAVTMVPALVVIAMGLNSTRVLVVSQVVLSFGIPFALIPLVLFTSSRRLMGDLVNHPVTRVIAWGITVLIVGLNLFLIRQTLVG